MVKCRAVTGTGLALLLGACAAPPTRPDPAYAPARPAVAAPAAANPGAIYQDGYAVTLFEDPRARRVGDVLTVILTESTQASKQATTSTKKENEIALANPTLLGSPVNGHRHGRSYNLEVGVDTSQEFSGSGASSQSNSLSGRLTVTVAEVLPNGFLVVRGEKLLALNQGDEFVRLAGIVRPQDIRPDNTVLSTQIANARISYGGNGALADANTHGWLGRFFLKIWPF